MKICCSSSSPAPREIISNDAASARRRLKGGNWDAFLTWALAQGYTRAQLVQSGLVKLRDENRLQGDVYDRFRARIMFPICNDIGEVIAFSGRILKEEEGAAKYLNSPETPLFRKGEV